MKKNGIKIMVIISMLFYSINLFAVTKQDIDRVEKEVNDLDIFINGHYKTIRANRLKSVDDILKKYFGSNATLIKRWFDIANQLKNRPSISRFVKSSKHKIKFYLDQMLLDNNKPMNQKDYEFVTKKIMSLGKHTGI